MQELRGFSPLPERFLGSESSFFCTTMQTQSSESPITSRDENPQAPACLLITCIMYHMSHIMCIVTVWQTPILCYVTLDTPVTVVTSGEPQSPSPSPSLVAEWGLSKLMVKMVS